MSPLHSQVFTLSLPANLTNCMLEECERSISAVCFSESTTESNLDFSDAQWQFAARVGCSGSTPLILHLFNREEKPQIKLGFICLIKANSKEYTPLAFDFVNFWEISRGDTWIWSMWGAATSESLKCLHLALENPDTHILMCDQTDVHPAPVKPRASWKAAQSTLRRHLLATAHTESIDQAIVAQFLLCACSRALSQPKLGLSLISSCFASRAEWQLPPLAGHRCPGVNNK